MTSADGTSDSGLAGEATESYIEPEDGSSSEDDAASTVETPASAMKSARQAIFASYVARRSRTITRKELQTASEINSSDEFSVKSMYQKRKEQACVTSPREYQVELFERAKQQNVIAVLDTGSGKTHISVLLLRHIFNQELEDRAAGKPHRVSFFLVDSVTLVMQQSAVLDSSMNCKVKKLYGAIAADLWQIDMWTRYLREVDVFVCTAEILHQALYRGFIRIHNINLLVFDEAHHAKKNHPYARIMGFYRDESSLQRPKIFSMTASPVDVRAANLVDSAHELEQLLDSQIVTASDQALLQVYVARPTEKLVSYSPSYNISPPVLTSTLKSQFGLWKVLIPMLEMSERCAADLGPWCGEQYWQSALTERQVKKMINRANQKINTEPRHKDNRHNDLIAALESEITMLEKAQKLVQAHNFAVPQPSKSFFSDKVLKLHECLAEFFERSNDFCCIVFVDQRIAAKLLYQAFLHIGSVFLRPGLLTGAGRDDHGDASMTFFQQHAVLDAFRSGKLNCLFATSIAEEGLDIQACNLVVRFNLPSTMIQYVQSRGRARRKNSVYVFLLEDCSSQDRDAINEIKQDERIMRDFCGSLPADRILQGNDDLEDLISSCTLIDSATGAKLTYATSIVLLEHFSSSLPNDEGDALTPQYHVTALAGSFKCEVILPEGSPIRGATGKKERRKALAKQSAAFEACRKLHEQGFLDANFLPIYRTKILPQYRNAQLAIRDKKTKGYCVVTKPTLWTVGRGTIPDSLYLTIIDVNRGLERPHCPIALLTRTQLPTLPTFPLYLSTEESSDVLIHSLSEPMAISDQVLRRLTLFTLRAYKDIWNKTFENDPAKMSYWLAPIRPNFIRQDVYVDTIGQEMIDWKLLKDIEQHEEIAWSPKMSDESIQDRFIVDKYDGSRRFYSIKVMHDLKPTDMLPGDSVKPKKDSTNILDFSNSLWRASRLRREHEWDMDQPVVLAELMLLRQNLLTEASEPEKKRNAKAYICLQPLKISALTTSAVAMLTILPPIIYRIESYLIALEAMEVLQINVGPRLALEAVTKNCDNSGDHDDEKVNFQQGMGANYERLEFLGDCFLKLATSIPLLAQEPTANEESLHIERMLMLCNQNLFNHAIEKDLPRFVRSQAFSRRTWYQDLVLLEGKGANADKVEARHRLGDKTVADICEAAIGAAFLEHNIPGAWCPDDWSDAITAVTNVVCNEKHTARKWSDYVDAYKLPPVYELRANMQQTALAKAIRRLEDYDFKHPRLLSSAFTHPSMPFDWAGVPSYQRFEFLGDALLDLACITHLFYGYPTKDPQWLTEHKMAMVSNEFYGALCVKLNFHKHLMHNNAALESAITNYRLEVERAELESKGSPDYWTNVSKPPKCLPDIVEAYVGALFLDSGMQYSQVQRFFDRHIAGFFTDMSIYDKYANDHPVIRLNALLNVELGCHEYAMGQEELPQDPGSSKKYIDMVMIHNEVICDVISSSQRYGKPRVATSTINLLSGLTPREFRRRYNCTCQSDVDGNALDDGNLVPA